MERMTYIYALRDPRDGRVFYVGKTTMLWKRFTNHLRASNRSGLGARINSLRNEGFRPILHVVEQCPDNQWQDRERFWIADFRARGQILCNRHPGGNSRSPGFSQPISDETRKKISETLKGKPLPAAFVLRQQTVDKKHLTLMTEKAALVCRGRKWPNDVKRRISESNKKTWATKLQNDPTLLARVKDHGKKAATKQWADMPPEKKAESIHRLGSWFRNLSPEQKSETQRQRAIKPRRKLAHAIV